jgi:HNH endonuclease
MARGFRGGTRRAHVVAELVERDGDRCWYCGCTFAEQDRACTIDHVLPVSRGGGNELANLRLACSYCNGRRARFPDGEYEESALLAERQRRSYRDAMLATGAWLPKRAFHHRAIRWVGELRWVCDDCRQGSLEAALSPALVPCAPWSDRPPSTWVRWWGDGRSYLGATRVQRPAA